MSNLEKPKISANVLGYNHREHLNACFENLLKQDYSNLEITYIDNNSADGSEEFVRDNFPQVKVIQTGRNTGYSGGHNIGLSQTDGEFVSFVNPDVVMEPDFYSCLIRLLLENDKIAGAQGKLLQPNRVDGQYLFDSAGIAIQRSRRAVDRGQHQTDQGQIDQAEEVFAINGACPLYRRSALFDIAINREILDEDMFAYWDDVDLGWRLRQRGWLLWYEPSAVAYHERAVGRSKEGYKNITAFRRHHKKLSAFTRRLSWKNHLLMIAKNDSGWPFWRDLPFIIGREIAMLGYIILFEPDTLSAVPVFFKQLGMILQKRKWIKKNRTVTSAEIDRWFVRRAV